MQRTALRAAADTDIMRQVEALLRIGVLIIGACFVACNGEKSLSNPLDYDQLIHLDAENLAEAGVREAYDALLPELSQYVQAPTQIAESIDNATPSYSVRSED
jgi:hypothetical protein